ncbi:MAG: hypothetical protein OXC07_03905 [Kistimonas sp.]|nr:hypothetical protein [Kistimonas sp.]
MFIGNVLFRFVVAFGLCRRLKVLWQQGRDGSLSMAGDAPCREGECCQDESGGQPLPLFW